MTTLLAACCSLATLAMAKPAASDLTIHNNTDFASTSKSNHGGCSYKLAHGITEPHTTNTVDKTTVGLACMASPTDCVTDIYITRDCSGPIIATITFDTQTGIKGTPTSNDPRFNFTVDPNNRFAITIDQISK